MIRLLTLSLLACKPAPPPVVEELAICESDDVAWVQRVFPVMWGRRAHGAAEVRAWAAMAGSAGRPAVIRAMASDLEFLRWWRQWITDQLAVARTGDKAYAECYGGPIRTTFDGSLTEHLRTADPVNPPQVAPFNMADVVLDALVADDLSVVWRAHLFARMYRPVQGANVSEEELEYNRRVNHGEVFFETYLNRNLDCVLCHNSRFSVTDDVDARQDHTWQLPGHHELALLGDDIGFSKDEAFAIFKTRGVVRAQGGRRPFGLVAACGRFSPPDAVTGPDMLGQDEGFLVDPYGPEGSVWQLERSLAEGVERLADGGLDLGESERVDGRDSFAYLLGARIADRVFESATGGRLTIAHGFPRNLEQAARLEAYTDLFVESRFSLQELLVAVTADPVFTAGLPDACGAVAYGLPPVCNPWSEEEDDPALRGNSPGDRVHRLPARVLQNSVHHHLGWATPTRWELSDEEEEFQASIGVFLRESQPGFNGTDFQGLLAFTERYATCSSTAEPSDWLDALRAGHTGTTGELVSVLKDRLVANGTLEDAERPLLAGLVGDLDAPSAQASEAGLRALCGAIVASPTYMLDLDLPVGPASPEALAPECERAAALIAASGGSAGACP